MYSRLIHTVDHIEGRLEPGFDALDAFLTHMWAVTVTGAPKTWAMQFIEDNEAAPRRWYGGAVGKIGFDGSMNTGLTLRTAHISGGIAAVRAGATLLFDSDPESEERETHIKARALHRDPARGRAGGAGRRRARPTLCSAPPARPTTRAGHRSPAPPRPLRVLLVDHQDSFVHTLADYFRQHDAEVTTLRAGFPADDAGRARPGPRRAVARAGPAVGLRLRRAAVRARRAGPARLRRLPRPAGDGRARRRRAVAAAGAAARQARPDPGPRRDALLAGLPAEFTAPRYHSLYATEEHVKGGFTVTAATPDGVVMAIEDDAAGRWAVQFHPESILTAAGRHGHQVIANVLAAVKGYALTGGQRH